MKTTEAFPKRTEVFSKTTEVFSKRTEVFLKTTEVFSKRTKVFLKYTKVFFKKHTVAGGKYDGFWPKTGVFAQNAGFLTTDATD